MNFCFDLKLGGSILIVFLTITLTPNNSLGSKGKIYDGTEPD